MNEADLAELLERHAVPNGVPGAAVGILRGGATSIACYGVADVTSGQPVTPDTAFSAGSLTKSMVATAISRLAGAGRLSFNDPVSAHVPELRGSDWAERGTIADLLANRSRLPLRSDLEFGFADRPDQDDGALSRLVADAAPGGRTRDFWSYSNVGWCVLGRVIETAADTTWEDAMRRLLLDEAGMKQTQFATSGAAVRQAPVRRVSGHDVIANAPVPVEPLTSRAYGPAGTTAVTTAGDLLRFAAMHMRDSALAGLRAAQADVRICGWLDSWCLGWARFGWDGGQVWGWDGLIDGERSVLRMVPQQQTAVVLLTNASTGREMYRSLFTELMTPLCGITVPRLRLEPVQGAAGDLSRFAGVYGWPDRQVEVMSTADGLLIASESEHTEVFPLNDRVFLANPADSDSPTLTFGVFDEAGRPGVLYEMLWGLPRLEG